MAMILNRQRQVSISIDNLEKFSARVRKLLKIPADAVTICLVSSAEIAKWNRAYRGKNKPTDVLSFTTDEPSVKHAIRKLLRKRTAAKSSDRSLQRRTGATSPSRLRLLGKMPGVSDASSTTKCAF